MLRAVHARRRFCGAVHRDHRARAHHVRRDQVHGARGLRAQPGHPAGRHLRQQRPGHRRRAQRRRADLRPDLRRGSAGGLGRRRHARARHRRLHAGRRAGGPHQPARRRHRPALHEDRRGRRAGPLAPRALQEADARAHVLPARRAHPAGGLPHDPRRGRARDPRGGDRPLQAVLSRGDRGGPPLVQVAHPRDDRAGALPLAGLLRRDLRRQGRAARASAARLHDALALRGADRRRRRVRAGPRRLIRLGLPLHELHALGHAGGDLGAVHPDADLLRQGQRRRLLRGEDELPRRHDRQPGRRRRLDRDRLGLPAAGLHRLPAHALARAAGARLHRGGDGLLLRARAT